jgi:hypothetical protein
VTFDDGYRHDLGALAEVAHAHGALFVVDAIQGLGAFPLDVAASGIDALYAGGAKWLMALQGVSFLWLRAELLDRIALRLPGWRSVADCWNFLDYTQPLAPDASRYEGGTVNVIGALSLATSLEILAAAGPDRIGAHVLALTDRLAEGLRARGYALLSDRSRDAVKSGIATATTRSRWENASNTPASARPTARAGSASRRTATTPRTRSTPSSTRSEPNGSSLRRLGAVRRRGYDGEDALDPRPRRDVPARLARGREARRAYPGRVRAPFDASLEHARSTPRRDRYAGRGVWGDASRRPGLRCADRRGAPKRTRPPALRRLAVPTGRTHRRRRRPRRTG